MTVKVTDPAEPISLDEIKEAEKRMGLTLPKDYRDFLLESNAGRPEQPCVFEMKDPHRDSMQEGTVERFLGITKSERTNLEDRVNGSRDRMPPDVIPIAYDPGGNLICLSIKGKHKDEVYFWDHEFEAEEDEEPTRDNLYLISKSFSGFLKDLRMEE